MASLLYFWYIYKVYHKQKQKWWQKSLTPFLRINKLRCSVKFSWPSIRCLLCKTLYEQPSLYSGTFRAVCIKLHLEDFRLSKFFKHKLKFQLFFVIQSNSNFWTKLYCIIYSKGEYQKQGDSCVRIFSFVFWHLGPIITHPV